MKLNTMEEHNPGKFYKDKLKDYESPFDLDAMFDKIEPEINPERKRRPMLFWFWGCGGIVGLLGLLSLAFYFYPIDSFTEKSNNSDILIVDNRSAVSSENIEREKIVAKNKVIGEIQPTASKSKNETSTGETISYNKQIDQKNQ